MRVICFGDEIGLEILEASIPAGTVCGIVVAEGRRAAMVVSKTLAGRLSVPYVIQPAKKTGSEFEDFKKKLKELNADLGLVCSYSLILADDVFNIPHKGTFNVHGGLLPEYRGANVLNWVLKNGEIETGVTIHKITKGVDEGPVLAHKKIPIRLKDTAFTLRERLKEATVDLIKESWGLLCAKAVPAFPQDESRARKWPRRRPEDGLIDWNCPTVEIYNLIRALVAPWPGAFYFDNKGKKVVIDHFLPLDEVKMLQKKQIGRVID